MSEPKPPSRPTFKRVKEFRPGDQRVEARLIEETRWRTQPDGSVKVKLVYVGGAESDWLDPDDGLEVV